MEKFNSHTLMVERKRYSNFGRHSWQFLKKFMNIELPYDLAIPKRNENTSPHKNLYSNVHSTIIHNSPRWKQPKFPSTNKWINKRQNIHLMNYYSSVKINKELIFIKTWVNPENTTLKGRNQSQKTTHCLIPFIWKVQNQKIHRERKWKKVG